MEITPLFQFWLISLKLCEMTDLYNKLKKLTLERNQINFSFAKEKLLLLSQMLLELSNQTLNRIKMKPLSSFEYVWEGMVYEEKLSKLFIRCNLLRWCFMKINIELVLMRYYYFYRYCY